MNQTHAPRWLPAGSNGGILCMLVGLVFLLLSDACAKWLLTWYPVPEVISLRALVVVSCLLIFHSNRSKLKFSNLKRHGPRAVFACFSTFLFVFSLAYIPLADASAAAFAGPLFLTALAGPMLAERVGWRRWTAVSIGFVGVLVMLRPFNEGIQWAILLAVGAAFSGAVRDLITRHISQSENPESILLSSNLMLFAVGIIIIPNVWLIPEIEHWIIILVSGVFMGIAHYLHIQAFRMTEASILAPFRYTSIIWSVLIGYAVWGELPDLWIVAGGSGIILSGLYIMHRERQLAHKVTG